MSESVFERALNKWGDSHQICKTIEELNECAAALSRYMQAMYVRSFRLEKYPGEFEKLLDNVASEVADVYVMMQQLDLIFGKTRISEAISRKVERLTTMVGGEKCS